MTRELPTLEMATEELSRKTEQRLKAGEDGGVDCGNWSASASMIGLSLQVR